VITYAWRTELEPGEADEVDALIDEAAAYDEEAEFSTVIRVDSDPAAGSSSQLVVRMRPFDADEDDENSAQWPLVAYLRVDVSSEDRLGMVQLVVKPEHRSLGVATLLFEKLGLPTWERHDWASTGATALQSWAHGDHPAAERMAMRFGAARVHEMWKLVRSLRESDDGDSDRVVPKGITVRPLDGSDDAMSVERIEKWSSDAEGAAWVSPAGREHRLSSGDALLAIDGSGEVLGVVRLDSGLHNGSPRKAIGTILTLSVGSANERGVVGRALLGAGLDHLRAVGVTRAQVYIDAYEETIVQLTRELSFEHDRSDVCYLVLARS
jgi:mycothiol synthase